MTQDDLQTQLEAQGGKLEPRRDTVKLEPRCQHLRANLSQCKAIATGGFTVCRVHGAGTRAAPGGRPPGTGRASSRRYLATLGQGKFSEKLIDFLTDASFLEMREEIALLRAFTDSNLEIMNAGTGMLVKQARAAFAKLEHAIEQDDPEAIKKHLGSLKRALDSSHAAKIAELDARALIQEQKILVESERKRTLEAREVMRLDEMLTLISSIRDVILERVTDPRVRNAIANDLRLILQGEKKKPDDDDLN